MLVARAFFSPSNFETQQRSWALLKRLPEDAAPQIRRRSAGVPPGVRRRSAGGPPAVRRRSARDLHRCRTGAAPVPPPFRSGSARAPANSKLTISINPKVRWSALRALRSRGDTGRFERSLVSRRAREAEKRDGKVRFSVRPCLPELELSALSFILRPSSVPLEYRDRYERAPYRVPLLN